MPRRFVNNPAFDKAYRCLSNQERELVDTALKNLTGYLETGQGSVGLGITRLVRSLYECRAGLMLRIIYAINKDEVIVSLVGTHDEVKKFLKRQ